MRRLAGVIAAVSLAGSALAAPVRVEPPQGVVTNETSAAGWSVLGEYRVSRRPTSLSNRSREPIVVAHPFDASRLAVVYAAGPGEESHPVIRISHDGGKTWSTAAGRPRGGGSHPMLAWGPGPRPTGPPGNALLEPDERGPV